ncbi:hypothetical protein [Companilactobacillus musae]|jgi:hypothetical protein|uniref:hypothetical protein n=1 Tax=Companilactobacillus musae TaxID=1903258 RepID=UPI000E64FD94|nr:hypothetical protein [Companilactobacillus musae]
MATDFTGSLSDQQITLNLKDNGIINYYSAKPEEINSESIFFSLKNNEMVELSFGSLNNVGDATNFIEIVVPENIIAPDFFFFLTEELKQDGYQMNVNYQMTISDQSIAVYRKYWENILPLLRAFGLQIVQLKKPIAKPRHKYQKSLANVPFKIDYNGSKATVYWVKRNELVIKKGAILLANAPLTKAGLIGFAGKFGLRLRQENENQIKENILTSDVTLRSVNEVGTFLYFAGTNSWKQFISPDGKTLDELTIVR